MPLYPKTSDMLVYDLIMEANPDLPVKLTPDNCRLEKVTAVTPSAATQFRNTKVKVHGLQGEGVEDVVVLYYDRVRLERVIVEAAISTNKFVNFTAKTLYEALTSVYETYGIRLTERDISDYPLAGVGVPDYTSTVPVYSLPTSPAYVGAVTLRYTRGKPLLSGLTQLVVPALRHPLDPAYGKTCIDMLTYGIDFTAYKDKLAVNAAGFAKWSELRAVLDSLGVPDYAAPVDGNTVRDALTTAVAGANTDYDRVVVQSGINADSTRGTAFYHYNI